MGMLGKTKGGWSRSSSRFGMTFAALLAVGTPLSAEDKQTQAPSAPLLQQWLDGPYATGNWGGLRDRLTSAGVTFSGSYTSDLLGNPVGGRSQGFANFQWLELKLAFDLEKLAGWSGGQFVISALSVAGQDLSAAYVGNFFTASQLQTPMNTFVLYDLYFQQRLLDDRFRIKVGRYSAGEEVGRLSILGVYVNGADDSHPSGLGANFIFPTPPKPTWTGLVEFKPVEELTLKYVIYQTNDWYRLADTHGWDFGIRPGDGISMVWEADWRPHLALPWGGEVTTPSSDGKTVTSTAATFPGEYRFGVYYSNFGYGNFDHGVTRDNFGFYWFGQQQVWQERPGSTQGLTVWAVFTLSPQERIAQFPFTAGWGASWVGLIPGRDRDLTLFGAYYGIVSPLYAEAQEENGQGYPTEELALEWSYRFQVTPWLYLQPDLQWIVRPGGTGNIPDALILGGEIGVTF